MNSRKPIHWKCCSLQRGKRRRWIIPEFLLGRERTRTVKVRRTRSLYEEAGSSRRCWSKSNWGILISKRVSTPNGVAVPCEVRVFPMIVKRQLNTWPGPMKREARSFEPAKALSALKDKGLRESDRVVICEKIAQAP